MWRGCFGSGFGWIIPLIFLGVFIYAVFSRRWQPPFCNKDYSRVKEDSQHRRWNGQQDKEKEELEAEVKELKTKLSNLQKKVKDLEDKD